MLSCLFQADSSTNQDRSLSWSSVLGSHPSLPGQWPASVTLLWELLLAVITSGIQALGLLDRWHGGGGWVHRVERRKGRIFLCSWEDNVRTAADLPTTDDQASISLLCMAFKKAIVNPYTAIDTSHTVYMYLRLSNLLWNVIVECIFNIVYTYIKVLFVCENPFFSSTTAKTNTSDKMCRELFNLLFITKWRVNWTTELCSTLFHPIVYILNSTL